MLVIRVVYRGCALPSAWTVLTAKVEKAWRPEWLRMLRQLYRAVPPRWTVIVLAERGLYARWLFRRAGLDLAFVILGSSDESDRSRPASVPRSSAGTER